MQLAHVPAMPPTIASAVLQSHPDLQPADLPIVAAIGTQEGFLPLSIDQARIGADALVEVRSLPLVNGISREVDVHESEGGMPSPSLVSGSRDVVWTDTDKASLYRMSPELVERYFGVAVPPS